MKPQRARHRAGFTLAELLVATMLLSIVMGSVYTVFHSSIRTWRMVERDYDVYLNARNFTSMFQREVDNLLRPAGHLMQGDQREITMFVVAEPMDPDEAAGRHLMQVRYRLNRQRREIIREEALVEMALPRRPLPGQELDHSRIRTRRPDSFVVARHVNDMRFRYFWTPRPPERERDEPPTRANHIILERHEENWGLPQGVELTLYLRDPNNPGEEMVLRQLLPVRNHGHLMTQRELEGLLGEYL